MRQAKDVIVRGENGEDTPDLVDKLRTDGDALSPLRMWIETPSGLVSAVALALWPCYLNIKAGVSVDD